MSLRPLGARVLRLVLGVAALFLLLVGEASAAPTVTGFTASPTALPPAGGSVTLSATVGGTATSCKFTATPNGVSGLAQVPCTTGQVSLSVTVPANAATTAKVYTFKLVVSGGGNIQATPVSVTVAATPAPSVSAFTATPAYLPPAGGSVSLSASASDATTCKFSSSPNFAGMPVTLPCTSGSALTSVTLPANGQAAPRTYMLTLTASRSGAASAVSTRTVIVASPAHRTDLAVSQTDSPDPVTVGGFVTYTLTVQNSGPNQATGVTLVDTLPSGTSYSGAGPSQGICSPSSGTVSCDLGVLAANGSASVSVTVQTTAFGTISNAATVSGHQTDPNSANNSSTEQTVVQPSKIAYIAAGVPDTSVQGIWTMNPNGTNNVRIVEGGAADLVQSPDRSKLAYVKAVSTPSGYVYEVWVIGIDGSDDHFLYSVGGNPVTPSWSGDGTKLIFATYVEVTPGNFANKAIVVDASGAPNPRFLLPDDLGGESSPAFSPDGQWVIFKSFFPRPDHGRYYIVKADGSTTPAAFDQTPYGDVGVVWSPDGNWFYFTTGFNTIHRASTDPTNQSSSVVTTFQADGPSRWSLSPQGDRVAYTTNSSSPVIAVVNVDGTDNRQITTQVQGSAPAGCYSPVWSPTGADVIMHCYFFPNLKIYRASSTAASPVNPILIGGGQSNEGPAVYAGTRPPR